MKKYVFAGTNSRALYMFAQSIKERFPDCTDKLWADIHPGPHAFAGNKAFEFFKKYL